MLLDCCRETGAVVKNLAARDTRRWGEIQGQIVWNWRLFKTPERPYNTSTTNATSTSSRKPIMMMSPTSGLSMACQEAGMPGNGWSRKHGGISSRLWGADRSAPTEPKRLDRDDAGQGYLLLSYRGGIACQMNSYTR